MRFLASWIAALTLSIGLASAQPAEAGDFRARAQLNPATSVNPATSGAGFNPVDFYVLDMPLYLGLMDLGLSEEEAFALSWSGDWDEDIVSGSWNWDEDFVDKANSNDSPGP